jgi:N-acetylglucosaminyl-diphospho-decaprenol L-rhamnosyltransferase
MTKNNDPVFAAINGFPSTEALGDNLSVLANQGYDGITVVADDTQQTEQTRDELNTLTSQHPFTLLLTGAKRNPGEKRNAIASSLQLEEYGDAILHFIDGDMQVIPSEQPAAKIREHLGNPNVGMGGGLVLTAEGDQSMFNYGPVFSFKSGISALKQARAEKILKERGGRAAGTYRDEQAKWLEGWPDTTTRPKGWPATVNEGGMQRTRTGADTAWVHEGNLFITANNLRRGGYFASTPIHEVQGLGVELRKQGMTTVFDPEIAVKHRGPEKPIGNLATNLASTALLAAKHGVFRYIYGS